MKKDEITIVDFGSGKIVAAVAGKSAGGDVFVKESVQVPFDGYDESGWISPENLQLSLRSLLEQLNERPKEVTVGVPGLFARSITREVTENYPAKRKIEQKDVDDLLSKAAAPDPEGRSIGDYPVYYILDGALKTFAPVGSTAQRLTALVCCNYVGKDFESTVTQALNGLGVGKVNFASVCEAQGHFVSGAYAVNGYCIVLDVGHIVTDVMLTGGASLLYTKSFSLGSGYIAADLSQVLKIRYEDALSLLSQINLKLEFQSGDAYRVGNVSCDAYTANEVAKARIEQIAEYIKKSFSYYDREISAVTPIVLTGGGLTHVKGGAEFLSYCLGKRVRTYAGVNPQTSRNEYTSVYGLAERALSQRKKRGIFSIFR